MRSAQVRFAAVGDPVGAANAQLLDVGRPGSWRAAPDRWLDDCIEAFSAIEAARRTEIAQPEGRIAHSNTAGLLHLVALQLHQSADVLGDDPRWPQAVWALEQAVKARAFQDELVTSGAWSALVARDERLAAAVRVEESARLPDGYYSESVLRRARIAQKHRVEDLQSEWRGTGRHVPAVGAGPVSIERLRAALREGEAYLGLVETADGPLWIAVSPDAFSAGRVATRPAVRGEPDRSPLSIPVTFVALVREVVASADTLLVCPEGDLIAVPWQLLPRAAGRDVCEVVALVPSAGTLVHLRELGPPAIGSVLSYLGVADDAAANVAGLKELGCVNREILSVAERFPAERRRVITSAAPNALHRIRGLPDHFDVLHLACHATSHGIFLGGRWVPPVELAATRLTGTILFVTGCWAGAFDTNDHNEMTGIVRQLMVVTRSRVAIISRDPVIDAASPLFANLVVSALLGKRPDADALPFPGAPRNVGQAVEWARHVMPDVDEADIDDLVPDPQVFIDPRSPRWWSPWMVFGDPRIRLVE
ncbi:CHAT domain-containing protein [Cryptosporangium sp. NPDC051539]|uniref:CHAT domain-containing protein n=1 Tax=Cryptosporangium sp. NPDC051539 TaxID=3363962 RepID=UPI00379AB24D